MPTKYIINATIECFLIIFIFMLMMMVFREMRAQGKLVKSDKILLSIFSVNVVGLGFDIVSYFVDNQTESLFVVMNRICIFVSFAYGAVLMLLFSYYVFALIEEEGGEKNRLLKQFVGLVCLVDLGILTVTQFTLDGYSGGLYYFDSSNKYMRGAYYSSHYFLIGVVFLITVVWLVAQKKVLSDTLLHSMIIACVAAFWEECCRLQRTESRLSKSEMPWRFWRSSEDMRRTATRLFCTKGNSITSCRMPCSCRRYSRILFLTR